MLASPQVHVPFETPLVEARFVERPNRFLVFVTMNGQPELVGVHLPDPGRLKELLIPGVRVWVRPAPGPNRKTRWSAVLTETPDRRGVVSIDTTLPNLLIRKALQAGALEEFRDRSYERAEFRHGRSRLDFLMSGADGRRLAVEVKSVTLVEDGVARFPDAITARGARHVRELADLARRPDWAAAVLFVLQRDDGVRIEAARSIDPEFADALAEAQRAGVTVVGRRCQVRLDGISLGAPVPVS